MNDKRTPPVNPSSGAFKYGWREHQEAMHESNCLMWKQFIKEFKKDNNNE